MVCGLTWPVGISTVFQKLLAHLTADKQGCASRLWKSLIVRQSNAVKQGRVVYQSSIAVHHRGRHKLYGLRLRNHCQMRHTIYRDDLTHWPRGIWNVQRDILKPISMIVGWGISWEIALRWMSLDLINDEPKLIQVITWWRQETSHYRNQHLLRFVSPCGVTRPLWVNGLSNRSQYAICMWTGAN